MCHGWIAVVDQSSCAETTYPSSRGLFVSPRHLEIVRQRTEKRFYYVNEGFFQSIFYNYHNNFTLIIHCNTTV